MFFMPREIQISLNGAVIAGGAEAFRKDGRLYLPVKFIAEPLGYAVGWDQQKQAVTLDNGQNMCYFHIGGQEYVKNDREFPLEEKPFMMEGRTYMPADDISGILGLSYTWDEDHFTIYLKTDKGR